MFDAARSQPVPMQRTRGRAAVALGSAPGEARLAGLRQEGAAKAILPRTHGRPAEVVFLNTAGGLTGGDALSYRLDLAAGVRAVATTQAAERGYASVAGPARVDVALSLGAGSRMAWLPQETILYDRADLARTTRADLGPGARLLMSEFLVFGRRASGETLRTLRLVDRRRITRAGRPVLVDPLAIDAGDLGATAGLAGAAAYATAILVAPGAEDAAGPVAEAAGAAAAISAWDGRLVLRAMGDPVPIRRLIARVVTLLEGGLPTVWPG